MKTLATILVAFAALAFSACGAAPPPADDVTATSSAFSTGTYCNNSNDTHCAGMPNGGVLTLGSYSCGGSTYTAVMVNQQQKATDPALGPVTWTEAITSMNGTLAPNFIVLQGNPNPGGISSLPMTQATGLLYLSQNVTMRMTRYTGVLPMTAASEATVTLLGGNLQYYPADATHPHGSWATWISAANQPGTGVCGNMAFSWST